MADHAKMISGLFKALNRIPILKTEDGWLEWHKALQANLKIIGLWKQLIGINQKPEADTLDMIAWNSNQDKLEGLLESVVAGEAEEHVMLHQEFMIRIGEEFSSQDKYEALCEKYVKRYTQHGTITKSASEGVVSSASPEPEENVGEKPAEESEMNSEIEDGGKPVVESGGESMEEGVEELYE